MAPPEIANKRARNGWSVFGLVVWVTHVVMWYAGLRFLGGDWWLAFSCFWVGVFVERLINDNGD